MADLRIEQLLREMVKSKASDLHIRVGTRNATLLWAPAIWAVSV